MQYSANITFEDHVDVAGVSGGWRARAMSQFWAMILLVCAAVVGHALAALLVEGARAYAIGGVNEIWRAFEMLDRVGLGWVFWLGVVLLPVAPVYLIWTVNRAVRLGLPLQWQPGARARLIRHTGEHHYTFTPVALEATDGTTREQFPWSQSRYFGESARCLYVMVKDGRYVLIPKSGCRSSDQLDALRAGLAMRLPPRVAE